MFHLNEHVGFFQMALIKPPTTTFFQVTFDLPNRGHCSPRKRSLKTPKKVTTGRTWYQKLDMLIYNFLACFSITQMDDDVWHCLGMVPSQDSRGK